MQEGYWKKSDAPCNNNVNSLPDLGFLYLIRCDTIGKLSKYFLICVNCFVVKCSTYSSSSSLDKSFASCTSSPLYIFIFVNRSHYAASALASPSSKIPQYVQGDLRYLINQIFTEKPKLGVAAFGTGVRGKFKNVRFEGGGIGQFSDPSSVFVDYETPWL